MGPIPTPRQPIRNIRLALRRSFDFSGRATRSEYWWFQLAYLVVSLLVVVVDEVLFTTMTPVSRNGLPVFLATFRDDPLSSVFELVAFLPLLSLTVRRLHDIGWPSWIAVTTLTPLLLYFILPTSELGPVDMDFEDGTALQFTFMQFGGAFMMLTVLMAVSTVVWLVIGLIKSKPENRYGPNPWLGPTRDVFI